MQVATPQGLISLMQANDPLAGVSNQNNIHNHNNYTMIDLASVLGLEVPTLK